MGNFGLKREFKKLKKLLKVICKARIFLLVDLRDFFSDLGSGDFFFRFRVGGDEKK